jgi:hypothetical protein
MQISNKIIALQFCYADLKIGVEETITKMIEKSKIK